MTLVLALDTSVDVRVGVARDGVVLARRHVADTRQHVEQLMPLVSESLADAGAGPSELDVLCIGLGPGPFTGLRVGVVAAQVLASVHRTRLHGVCSLDVLAMAANRTGDFVVASDARRKEVYWARYRGGNGLPVRLDGPHVSAPEALPELPVLGPGVAAYRDRLGARPLPDGPSAVDAGLLAARGADLPSAGIEPLYLRRPDAAVATKRKSTLVRRVPRRRP
jgi:tRNA threonylcarbamoyl adenosine modification protein YeaZ